METAVAQNYAKVNPAIAVSNVPVTIDESISGSVVCMPKGSTDLVDFVNGVIDEVQADGSFDTAVQEAFATAETLGQ
jgi:ABC-type amino acid transport substrate-binding protein